MSKAPKAHKDPNGKFVTNEPSQKAGLNKGILDKSWYQLEIFTQYKAILAGKVVFKVFAQYSSQECADCGHILDLSIVQSRLACRKKVRAVRRIALAQNWLDSKFELPSDGVLARYFKKSIPTPITQSRVLPYIIL